jgi:hypothetical protein
MNFCSYETTNINTLLLIILFRIHTILQSRIEQNPVLFTTIRGSQRDVVYLGWPIAPSNMSPNAGKGVAGFRPMSTAVHMEPKRRKIRLIESKQCQMSLSKKMTCKGTLRHVFYLSEAPFTPPLTHCVYVYTVYLFTQGGGGVELTREKVRGAIVHKAGRKYQHDGPTVSPVYKL